MESQGLDEARARAFARETGIRRTAVAQKNLQKDLAAKTKASKESERRRLQCARSWEAFEERKQGVNRHSSMTFSGALAAALTAKKGMRKNTAQTGTRMVAGGVVQSAQYTPIPYPNFFDRLKSVVSRGSRALYMPNHDYRFIADEIASVRFQEQVRFFTKMCGVFPAAISEALMNPDTAANLKAVTIKLDVASAAELWLSMHIKQDQWDDMAKALNSRMPPGQKFTGGVLPCTNTIISWLKKCGAELQAEDVELVTAAELCGHSGMEMVD
jgi:hypothetical protein